MFFGVATEYLFINAPDDANITRQTFLLNCFKWLSLA